MKTLLILILSFLSLLSFASSEQKLTCTNGSAIYIRANLNGYQISNLKISIQGEISQLKYIMTATESYDMYLSKKFNPETPYPTYSFYINDNNQYVLSLPGGDMRNFIFVGLLSINGNETELNCFTKSI